MTEKDQDSPPSSGTKFPFAPGKGESTRVNPGTRDRIPLAKDKDGEEIHLDKTTINKSAEVIREEEWIGQQIGPYVIQAPIAKGGMGAVFQAEDVSLRRKVALKIMLEKLAGEEEAIKRFEREARATAMINHPNIALIYMVGLSDEGFPFLAMEYIAGESLMHKIRARQKLGFSLIAHYMEQTALALKAAHKEGIIHRDIKPHNIMVGLNDTVKVVDFGLAKVFQEDSFRTMEGMVLGTPRYMAPEQSQGRNVDHRADIYAFGATFYHVITGRSAFDGDSPVQIMMKHVTAPLVPMRSLNPDVPIEFDEIIGRCMRKDVDERYQDYETLLVDLKQLRLQWTAKEHGALLGPAGEGMPTVRLDALGNPMPPPPSGSSIHLPPSQSNPSNMLPSQSSGRILIEEESGDDGMTTGRMILLGVIAVVIIIGIFSLVAGFFTDKPETTREVAQNGERTQRSGLVTLLERIAAAREGNGEQAEEIPADILAYQETLDTLTALENAAFFMKNEGLNPRNIREIVGEGSGYKLDDAGYPLDGWGNRIAYVENREILISAGMDGVLHSDDDITIEIEGEILTPAIYIKMLEEFLD